MSNRARHYQTEDIEEVDGHVYFSQCPVTEAGMFDLPEKVEIIVRREPTRAVEFVFVCPSCSELHKLIIPEKEL